MDLKDYHYSRLKHMRDGFGVYGWEECDDTLQDLEELGYVHGSWFGSLDMEPRPVWQITRAGEKALNDHTGCNVDVCRSESPHKCTVGTQFCITEHT